MKKALIIAVSLILVLVIGYNIFQYAVKTITEREVKRITQEEIGRITGEETGKITQNGVDRITDEIIKQKTEEMTQQIFGVSGGKSLQEVECDKKTLPRQFSSASYYAGPLIDAHLHMPSAFQIPSTFAEQADWHPATFGVDLTQAELICVFDKGKVKSALGFYLTTNLLTGTSVNSAKKMDKKYPGRVTPFLMSPHLNTIDLTADETEEILKDHPNLFKGLGEIAFYRAEYKGMSPEDPKFLAIYDLAKKYNLIVMIHPDEGQRSALERILQKYPEVTFLFHGYWVMGPYVAEILAKYPNAYFSLDINLWDLTGEDQSEDLFGSERKEKFIADMKRDYEEIQKAALAQWKEAIEANPDKYLWGTDRADPWQFDTEVSALIEESGRAFIGQLDPAVQEKFAYKNAERLLQER